MLGYSHGHIFGCLHVSMPTCSYDWIFMCSHALVIMLKFSHVWMPMCFDGCMFHACKPICLHTHMLAHAYAHMFTCLHAYMLACSHDHMLRCSYLHMASCLDVYMSTCSDVYIPYLYMSTFLHVHMLSHSHVSMLECLHVLT